MFGNCNFDLCRRIRLLCFCFNFLEYDDDLSSDSVSSDNGNSPTKFISKSPPCINSFNYTRGIYTQFSTSNHDLEVALINDSGDEGDESSSEGSGVGVGGAGGVCGAGGVGGGAGGASGSGSGGGGDDGAGVCAVYIAPVISDISS